MKSSLSGASSSALSRAIVRTSASHTATGFSTCHVAAES